MRNLSLIVAAVLLLGTGKLNAQDLEQLIESQNDTITDYTAATFKTTRLMTGHSVENPADGDLMFILSHRFGQINQGAYELWGLDQATMRFGFEYGIGKRMSVGVGRSSWEKTYDGFIKYKVLRQSSGKKVMPLTLTFLSTVSVNSLKWEDPDRDNFFSSRMSYCFQLLAARKFSNSLSLQLMPSLVHHNLVPEKEDKNDIFSMGAGGRIKLSNRISFNAEYYYVVPDQVSWDYRDCFSFGFDIETGGHVFQLIVTNTQAQFEPGFITETSGKWSDGDVYFGFNLTRTFTVKKPKEFSE